MISPGKKIYVISNGDFRDSACQTCWPKQKDTIDRVSKAFDTLGYDVEVLPEYNESSKHGFITWPGLVAPLNHSATLSRLCVDHSRLWSESFNDDRTFMDRAQVFQSQG